MNQASIQAERPEAAAGGGIPPAEERIRTILEMLPIGVVAAEASSGHILYVNGALCRMLGFGAGELLGMALFDIHPMVEEPRIIAQFEKALRGEASHAENVPVLRRDGHVLTADVHYALSEIRGQRCLLGIYADTTERTRARDALEASETQLRTILNNINDVVWSMSYPEWKPLYLSASGDSLFGRRPDARAGKPVSWMEWIHPGDRPQLEQTRKSLDERGYAYGEYRIVRADGSERWIASRCKLAYDGDGQPVRVDGVATDITGRRRAEEALRESENKLRSMFQAMTDVVFVLDAEGRYVEIAPTRTELMVRPPRELIGKTVGEVLPPESAALCVGAIRQALETGEAVPIDYRLEIQGRPVWFAGMVSRMTDQTVVWVARDITARKRAEDALRKDPGDAAPGPGGGAKGTG
ncbi:MAG: PAS domain S-box protein [Lentisphaerae bacterium]|nr:PAS domain S-box protein [Lentisphaerota bacterium]